MTGSATTTPSGRTRRSRPRAPVTPAERFQPARRTSSASCCRSGCPRSLAAVPEPAADADRRARRSTPAPTPAVVEGGPVEFDRVVPPSGNLWAMRRQFWLGPQRAGQTVRFWASVDVIHLIDRRRPRQEPALAPEHHRSRPARAPGRGRRRARRRCRRPSRRGRDRGRPRGQQQRPRRPRRPPGARRRDPRRPPGDRPHRTADADVPRPRHARAAARPPQPAHPRASAAAAGRAPRRPATAARGPSRSPFSAASAPPA